jgi:hypothetical protein
MVLVWRSLRARLGWNSGQRRLESRGRPCRGKTRRRGERGRRGEERFSSVIISGFCYPRGERCAARAFVWFGGASGLGPNGTSTNADWSNTYPNDGLISSLSTAGRVNDDPFDDVMVGCMQWDGRDATGAPVPAGAYFLRLEANGEVRTTKLTLTR